MFDVRGVHRQPQSPESLHFLTNVVLHCRNDTNAIADTLRKDGDYLTLGFWLVEPDNARGAYSYAPLLRGQRCIRPG